MFIRYVYYRLIAVDLQIVIQGGVRGDDNTKIRLNAILEKSKETVLEFYKGTAKVL